MIGASTPFPNTNSYYTPSAALGGFDWMGSAVFQGQALLNAQANVLSLGMMDMRGLTGMVARMNGSPYPAAGAGSTGSPAAAILQEALLTAMTALQAQAGPTTPPLPAAGSPLNLLLNR